MDFLNITKSKTRTAILKHFFFHKNDGFYLRQLERLLGISAGNLRRELLALSKMGLFKKEKKANQIYYFLNKDMPIFNEIKAIVSKTVGLETILQKELRKIKGIELSFIYGSVAREEDDNFSDIDLFVVGDIIENDLLKAVKKAEKIMSKEINYVIFTKQDIVEAVKSKKVFLKDVLNGKKVFLIGDANDLAKIIK
ncbi:MAG: nucleotidyltransferase domain-containing protein [Candidatus Omnitrophica bacterium]|nr:nucleotidyltransferase domain-containing protein [Candidatus Omnitrophota bacterium]